MRVALVKAGAYALANLTSMGGGTCRNGAVGGMVSVLLFFEGVSMICAVGLSLVVPGNEIGRLVVPGLFFALKKVSRGPVLVL